MKQLTVGELIPPQLCLFPSLSELYPAWREADELSHCQILCCDKCENSNSVIFSIETYRVTVPGPQLNPCLKCFSSGLCKKAALRTWSYSLPFHERVCRLQAVSRHKTSSSDTCPRVVLFSLKRIFSNSWRRKNTEIFIDGKRRE